MRRGFTLLELLVVLVILGALAGIAGYSLASARPDPGNAANSRVREQALRAGVPVLDSATQGTSELYLPDGRAVPVLKWTRDSAPE